MEGSKFDYCRKANRTKSRIKWTKLCSFLINELCTLSTFNDGKITFASSGNMFIVFKSSALFRSATDSLVSVKNRSKIIPNMQSDMDIAWSCRSDRETPVCEEESEISVIKLNLDNTMTASYNKKKCNYIIETSLSSSLRIAITQKKKLSNWSCKCWSTCLNIYVQIVIDISL